MLTIIAPTGSVLSISSISFDARRTASEPSNIDADVNGTSFSVIGSPGNGAFNGVSASGSATNLTGTINININSSGGSGSNQNIRIDNVSIGVILPVKFSDFNLYNNFDKAGLAFSTASESNNDFFTIERSSDGRSFEAIGKIKGAGNSTHNIDYAFTNESPASWINITGSNKQILMVNIVTLTLSL